MGKKYGKHEWKIKLIYSLCIVVVIMVAVGAIGGAYMVIQPRYAAYQEEKAEKKRLEEKTKNAEEEKKAEEEAKKAEEEKKKAEEEAKKESSSYLIANSDSKYLTDNDIKGLSLQQLNYAKNEIYARRGRKFQSKELQDYFNSKSWYKGTIEPDMFQEGMLNDYEKKNAEFLKNAEYSKNPAGYPLDQ